MAYVRVALLSPPFSELTYSLPPGLSEELLQPGQRLAVPLGKSAIRTAVLLDFLHSPELPPGTGIKAVIWPLERRALLSEEYLKTVSELALRQAASVGRVLGSVLPAGLKNAGGLLRWFGEAEKTVKINALAGKDRQWMLRLGDAWRKGEAVFIPSRAMLGEVEYAEVCKDPPWPLRPTSRRQTDVMEYLWEHGGKTRRQLADFFGGDVSAVLEALVKKELIRIGPRPEDPFARSWEDFPLNKDDNNEERLEALVESLAASPAGLSDAFHGLDRTERTVSAVVSEKSGTG
ncbi:MAG: hypothetical protein IJD04_02080, partial [Desulfovibrionaceae bacterium]|nr:hypothetical protein [Desulfovibrionaceae bacterium]